MSAELSAEALCPGLGPVIAREPEALRAALRRAVAALERSDGAGAARAELKGSLPRGPLRSAPAAALLGLLAAAEGDAEAARGDLDRAVALSPRAPWALVLRAALSRAAGRLEDARRDLDAALALGPHWRFHHLRAEVLSESGHVPEAIADIDAALASTGPDASLLSRKAQFFLQRRNYPEALEALDRVVALSPGQTGPLASRADLYSLTDRLPLAQADLDRALELAPDDADLRLARLRVLVQRRRRTQALRDVAKLSAGPARIASEARFYRGCLDFADGRPGRGRKDFLAVMKAWPQGDSLSMRARFYWIASRSVDPQFLRKNGMTKTINEPARLFLCGLGIFPPYTASLDVLHGLSRCDVLFNNVAGPEVRQLLAEFCADVRPASYQAWQDEPKWADTIFAELNKGRKVGFVTRGHPLVFGGLAVELLRRCKAEKVPYQSFASVSSIDHILAITNQGLGDHMEGLSVFDRPAIEKAAALNTQQPLLACFYSGIEERRGVAAFRKSLERFYPADHECLMFGPKYDAEPAPVPLGKLEERYPVIHSSLMLYLPPRKAHARKA